MNTALVGTVVVFGASGFVGRNIVEALRGRASRIIGVTHSATSVPGCDEVVRMSELGRLRPLPEDAVAIHVAAFRYDASRFELAQSDILKNNVSLVTDFFHFCAERGIQEVRYASSMAVYDSRLDIMDDAGPLDLNSEPHRNEAFYGWSKRWAEKLGDLYQSRFGINTLTFRLSNPYGPYDSTDPAQAHVAPAFVMKALNRDPVFEIKGDPEVRRDFTYVGDVTKVFVDSLTRRGESGTFNLCTGRTWSLLELAQVAMKVAGVEKPIRAGLPGASGPKARVSTSRRIAAEFGATFADLETGMKPTIDWYRYALS